MANRRWQRGRNSQEPIADSQDAEWDAWDSMGPMAGVLDVEGAVDAARLSEFRQTNIRQAKELEDLKEKNPAALHAYVRNVRLALFERAHQVYREVKSL